MSSSEMAVERGSRLRPTYWLAVGAVAFAVRAAVVFAALGAMPLVSDALSYSKMAERLLGSFPGEEAYYWPPGTAYWLLLFFRVFAPGAVVARLATITMSVASVLLVTGLCERILRRPRAARWVGWIAALYPPSVMMAGQPASQHLVTLCLIVLAGALIAGTERRRFALWAVAGAALGGASLTRPSTLFVTPLLLLPAAVFALRRGRAARRGALLLGAAGGCACLAAVVLPVMGHNASHDGGLCISVNSERNFFLGNNRYTPDYKTSHLAQRKAERLDDETRAYVLRYTEKCDRPARRAMVAEALDYIRNHKLRTLWRTLNRARAYWGFDYLASRQIQLHYQLGTGGLVGLLVLEAGGYALLMLLVLAGLIGDWSYFTRPGRWLLLLVVLAYEVPYALAFSCGTYHFPVVWLLMPFAGAALARAEGRARRLLLEGPKRRRLRVAVLLFALIQVEYGYHLAVLV